MKKVGAFLIKYIFVSYALVATIVAGIYLAGAAWSWPDALAQGARAWVYGILVSSMAITSAAGHLFFADSVAASQGHQHSALSRMFQWELGVFTLAVGVVSTVVDEPGQTALAVVWGVFIVAAGVRHAIKREPLPTVVGDLWAGALLLATSIPGLWG